MSLLTVDLDTLRYQQGDRVLDLGCGEGRHAISAAFAQPVVAIGVDLRVADLATARARASEFNLRGQTEFTCASGYSLPFSNAAFDIVICSEVLEHLHDYRAALREIDRVLRPGGQLIVSVPRYTPELICWSLSTDYFLEEGGHLRIFEAGALRACVETHGFHFRRRHWAHALHSPYWWLRCALGEHSWPARAYHRLLVWDLMRNPWITRQLDRLLNPLIGKSVVLYFTKASAT